MQHILICHLVEVLNKLIFHDANMMDWCSGTVQSASADAERHDRPHENMISSGSQVERYVTALLAQVL